jgi:hypothetical protein
MLNVIYADCHKKALKLSVVVLNVVMLSAVMLNVVVPLRYHNPFSPLSDICDKASGLPLVEPHSFMLRPVPYVIKVFTAAIYKF